MAAKSNEKSTVKHRSNKKTIILFVVLMCILGLIAFSSFISTAIRTSEPFTVGNTAGNLWNGGLWCETEDYFYFSNIAKSGALCRIDKNLENEELIYDDNACYINADEHYLFYSRRNNLRPKEERSIFSVYNTGLFRVSHSGKSLNAIAKNPVGAVIVFDNKVFFQNYDSKKGITLVRTDLAGNDLTELTSEEIIPLSADRGCLYYSGVSEDHGIHKIDVESLETETVYGYKSYKPSAMPERIYFISTDNGYVLASVGHNGNDYKVLVDEFVSFYNVTPDEKLIVYQADNTKANYLGIYHTDTGEKEHILDGDFNSLSIVGDYLFFRSFDETTEYVYKLDGSARPRVFKSAPAQ